MKKYHAIISMVLMPYFFYWVSVDGGDGWIALNAVICLYIEVILLVLIADPDELQAINKEIFGEKDD